MMNLKKMVLDAEERLKQELGKLWAKLQDPDVSSDEKGRIRAMITKLEHEFRAETGAVRGLCKK